MNGSLNRSAPNGFASPELSRAALAAGLPARYLYWSGRSGRRYLFTCVGSAALADFETGVALCVASGEIVWIGDVAMLSRMPESARPRRAEVHVHFLAETHTERRAVIDDLRPERQPVRLAA